jgi:hypothetical protein
MPHFQGRKTNVRVCKRPIIEGQGVRMGVGMTMGST